MSDIYHVNDLELDAEICRRNFRDFIPRAWPCVEPAQPFIPNWHIDAIADHAQAAVKGQLNKPGLVINVPPGSTKSVSMCVMLPAWLWTWWPGAKSIFGSYSEYISYRDSGRTADLIRSDWYQSRFGKNIRLKGVNAAKISNWEGGFRFATTIGGAATGEHADVQVVDDPIKPLEVTGSTYVARNALDRVSKWWNETMSSRLVNFETGVRIIIMQRLHDNDLAGEVLKEQGYEHLMLPMEFEPKRKCMTSIGFEDPRTEEGELLCPARSSAAAVATIKKALGSRGAAAQLQQRPKPAEGTIIKEQWIRYMKHMPVTFDLMIQSWDCTFEDGDDHDFVSGQVWGQKGADYYLIDRVKEKMGFVDTVKAVKMLYSKYPRAFTKLVEKAANGAAVVDHLKRDIPGFELVPPEGGKISRCYAVEPIFESGNVFIPHPDNCPWVKDYVAELTGFPSMAHDDDVDATTQALVWMQKKSIAKLKQAMRNSVVQNR